jgi:hypothetical protein
MVIPKTFNNHFGFERGLWQRKTGCFSEPAKKERFGKILKCRSWWRQDSRTCQKITGLDSGVLTSLSS